MQLVPRYLVSNRTHIVADVAGFITEYRPVYNRQLQVYKGIDNVLQFKVLNADQKPLDIVNYTPKFVAFDENNNMKDAGGYHKSLFTAMNADAIANHFYEQGKADAIKTSVAKTKNINMDPRQSISQAPSGVKFRVMGDNSSDFKLKLKQK